MVVEMVGPVVVEFGSKANDNGVNKIVDNMEPHRMCCGSTCSWWAERDLFKSSSMKG